MGLVTVLLFSFIMSFDEVTVTILLIGPDVIALPTRIFGHVQGSASPVVAVSGFLVGVMILLVFLLQRFVGLELFIKVVRSR